MVVLHSFEELAEQLDRFRRRLSDLSGAGKDVFAAMEQEADAVFRTEGKGTWPPLAPSTQESKAPGSRPLEASGALRRSLGGRGPGSLREVRRNQANFGTSVRYAAYQHFGDGSRPARPVLPDVQDRSFGKRVVAAYEQEIVRVSAGLVEMG